MIRERQLPAPLLARDWLVRLCGTRQLAERAVRAMADAATASLAPSSDDIAAFCESTSLRLREYAVTQLIPRHVGGSRTPSSHTAPVAVVHAWRLWSAETVPQCLDWELIEDASGARYLRRSDGPSSPVAVAPWLWHRVDLTPLLVEGSGLGPGRSESLARLKAWVGPDASARERRDANRSQQFVHLGDPIEPACPGARVARLDGAPAAN